MKLYALTVTDDLMESNWNNLVKFCVYTYNPTFPQLAYIIEILSQAYTRRMSIITLFCGKLETKEMSINKGLDKIHPMHEVEFQMEVKMD